MQRAEQQLIGTFVITSGRIAQVWAGSAPPIPEPIGAAKGITAAAPASISLRAFTTSSLVYGSTTKALLHQDLGGFPQTGDALRRTEADLWGVISQEAVSGECAVGRADPRVEDPREIESWNIGLRLVKPRIMVEVLEPLKSRLSLPLRTTIRVFRKLFPKLYQLNLFAGQSPC